MAEPVDRQRRGNSKQSATGDVWRHGVVDDPDLFGRDLVRRLHVRSRRLLRMAAESIGASGTDAYSRNQA